jgi:hypothetical protein
VLKRIAVRLTPALFVGAVLGASFIATPLGSLNLTTSVCSTGYLGAPTVSSITPTSGSAASNTYVIITGCGFTGVTSVHFGATAAEFLAVSDTRVDAASPVHAAGTVDVTVTTPLGTSATTAADHFTFVDYAAGHACTSATINPTSATQEVGSSITFIATSAGCPNPMFAYWIQFSNGLWYKWRGFDTNPTWTLSTTNFAPGTYTIHVWANQAGHQTARLETMASSTLTLTGCTSASILPTSTSAPAGTPVDFTAGSSGCSNATYEYWVQMLDGKWYLKRTFGDADWTWDTSGLRPGTYTVHVWANQTGGYGGRLEAVASSTVTLTGCTSASVSPSSGSSAAGTPVVFTASSSGCPSPVYEFWIQDTQGIWHRMTTFGGNTWTWNNAGWGKGVYHIHVWANQANSETRIYETIGASTRTLT